MRNKILKKPIQSSFRATIRAIRRLLAPQAVPGALAAVALAGGLAAPLQAQRFVEITAERLPALAGRCMDADTGDADGDGDLDIALAMEFEPNVLLLNDGSGRFRDASNGLPRAIHDSEDVAFVDFDADGDLDLVFVSEDDRQDELYLNDAGGRFADASDRLSTDDVSNAHAVLDLDADGVPDVLTGNIGVDRVLIGDGAARFSDETRSRWPQRGTSRTQDIELADVDGDGDLDVLLGNEGQNELFINEGGRLADETAARLPIREDETREIRAADFDADGDLDLAVANVSFVMNGSPQDFLLINDGTGRFETAAPERFPEDARSNFTIQAVDLDADGDFDVIAPATVFSPAGAGDYLVLLNDGSGSFVRAEPGTVLPADATGNGFDIEVADFDGDGSAELLLCNRASGPDAARSGGVLRLLGPNSE